MRLYLVGIGDCAIHFVNNFYVEIIILPLTTHQLKEKKEQNHAMLEIVSSLRYVEFDDIKGYKIEKEMWNTLQIIYREEKSVLREKSENLDR